MLRRPALIASILLLSGACGADDDYADAGEQDGETLEFRDTLGDPPPPEWCVGPGMCTMHEPCEETILCGDGREIETVHLCDPFSGCLTEECYPAPGTIEDEVCNGLDDDCNGTIDGVATPDCDDGLSCTFDLCVEGECAPVPKDEVCVTSGCAKGQCNDDDFGGAEGEVVTTDDGCVYLLDDDYCENVYDRCACNGQSTCSLDPSKGDGSGCEDPRPYNPVTGESQYPCESDENNCTAEACCEPDEDCRWLEEMPEDEKAAYDAICLFADRDTPSATGELVGCPGIQVGEEECDDGDPCKIYECNPDTGGCVIVGWADPGAQVAGCGLDSNGAPVYGNAGCSTWECNGGGYCVQVPADLPEGHPNLLCDGDPGQPQYPTCYRYTCNGQFCDTVGYDALCPDDDNACSIPSCGVEPDPEADVWGCGWVVNPDCAPD